MPTYHDETLQQRYARELGSHLNEDGDGEDPTEPLTCDFCGAVTDDPWHTSDATRKHLHQCDACHADSGQKLTDEQIRFIAEAHGYDGWDSDLIPFVRALLCASKEGV